MVRKMSMVPKRSSSIMGRHSKDSIALVRIGNRLFFATAGAVEGTARLESEGSVRKERTIIIIINTATMRKMPRKTRRRKITTMRMIREVVKTSSFMTMSKKMLTVAMMSRRGLLRTSSSSIATIC